MWDTGHRATSDYKTDWRCKAVQNGEGEISPTDKGMVAESSGEEICHPHSGSAAPTKTRIPLITYIHAYKTFRMVFNLIRFELGWNRLNYVGQCSTRCPDKV
jgi:hypothetical protein